MEFSNLLCHFTDRHGGMSEGDFYSNNLALHVNDNAAHVKENRRLTCKALNIETDQLVSMDQVHGTHVRLVRGKCADAVPLCDGIMTDRKDIALMVMVADCTPVLIYDPTNEAIAAVHVGRQGAFKNILKETIMQMQEHFGSKPEELHVELGPNIKSCCYAISGDVLSEAKESFSWFVAQNYLDLNGIMRQQLETLRVQHIVESDVCTCCDEDYFSYRRDGVTGRCAGIIMMRGNHG